MKILILTDYDLYGGVAKASDALQKCLRSNEINVERYPIYDKAQGLLRSIFSIIKSSRYLYSHRFDKVILMHFEAIFVGLLCRPFRSKDIFINAVHTDLHGYYCSASYVKRVVLRVIFWLLRNDSIVFDSKEAELKAKNYFGLTNTRTIYNVVAQSQTLPPKIINDRLFKFGSVSRLHSGKNVDLLIRVFNSFWINNKDTRLLIFGDGPELNRLKEYVCIFPCSEAVTFEGYVGDSDEIYGQIDSLVGFSSMEGFGLVILEALVRNIPVLYSDCSCGPREILMPESDPCSKTDTYQIGSGGILVRIPKLANPYSRSLQESEKIVLEALFLLYKDFEMIKKDSSVDLERFSLSAIRQQWIYFLSI